MFARATNRTIALYSNWTLLAQLGGHDQVQCFHLWTMALGGRIPGAVALSDAPYQLYPAIAAEPLKLFEGRRLVTSH